MTFQTTGEISVDTLLVLCMVIQWYRKVPVKIELFFFFFNHITKGAEYLKSL